MTHPIEIALKTKDFDSRPPNRTVEFLKYYLSHVQMYCIFFTTQCCYLLVLSQLVTIGLYVVATAHDEGMSRIGFEKMMDEWTPHITRPTVLRRSRRARVKTRKTHERKVLCNTHTQR